MGILGGMWDTATSIVGGAAAPVVGVAKMIGTGIETNVKVLGDVLTLQPGKALDDMSDGLKKQVDNVVGIPRDQWSAVKGAAHGMGETLESGVKFVGEPIRGAARIGCNGLETMGRTGEDLLEGNFRQAGSDYAGGVGRNFQILGETATNQVHNLF